MPDPLWVFKEFVGDIGVGLMKKAKTSEVSKVGYLVPVVKNAKQDKLVYECQSI